MRVGEGSDRLAELVLQQPFAPLDLVAGLRRLQRVQLGMGVAMGAQLDARGGQLGQRGEIQHAVPVGPASTAQEARRRVERRRDLPTPHRGQRDLPEVREPVVEGDQHRSPGQRERVATQSLDECRNGQRRRLSLENRVEVLGEGVRLDGEGRDPARWIR